MNTASQIKKALLDRSPADVNRYGRTATFEENVVSSISEAQRDELRRQLSKGDGGELRADDLHRPRAHSIHSSAMLAFNVFGFWLGREAELRIAGIEGFDSLELEAKQPIFPKGRAPNLDLLLEGNGSVLGVESKLTETLARHKPAEWRATYRDGSCRNLLEGGWREAFESSLAGDLQFEYLHAEQLIKHALGLRECNRNKRTTLVYVFWRPVGENPPAIVDAHQRELDEFAALVSDSALTFIPIAYEKLWAEWDRLGSIEGLGSHVDNLRARYLVKTDELA